LQATSTVSLETATKKGICKSLTINDIYLLSVVALTLSLKGGREGHLASKNWRFLSFWMFMAMVTFIISTRQHKAVLI